MAGLGRKVFVAGDVLTAAQVQGFLQDQAIMVFANGTARDGAIPSPSEGMFAYLNDSNSLTFYDSANWLTYPASLTNTLITNGTVVSSTITGGTATNTVLDAPEEEISINATSAAGTVQLNAQSAGVTYFTSNASGNWVFNVRGDASTTLNSVLGVGQAISHVFINTNGTTAYFGSTVWIDGTATTTNWQGAGAPSSGNANALDVYSLTVIKTATTPTYKILASQAKFT